MAQKDTSKGKNPAPKKTTKPKTSGKNPAPKKTTSKKATTPDTSTSMLDSLLDGQVGALLDSLKELPGQAVKIASGKAMDQALKVLKHTPEQLELMGKAGTSLKDLRQVGSLTINELATAIDLKNPDLLKAVEDGKAALPFEILLRLASLYARNNPVPFIMKYARTYNPRIWELMKTLGLDKLTLTVEREMLFLNIYRSRDAARLLSDEGYERVHAFTKQAFDMALHFVAEQENIDFVSDNAKESGPE